MIETSCAVVRMYNESRVLGSVLAGLQSIVDEVICIDDGSTDGSADIARALGATVVRHTVNLGGGAAMRTGVDYALRETSHSFVVNFDADGQHRAVDARRMLQIARHTGTDVVLGTRDFDERSMPWPRRVLLRAALCYSRRTTGLALTDTHNGLRVFNRRALAAIRLTQSGMAYATELETSIATAGLSWLEVPVSIVYDAYTLEKGQSNFNAINIVYDLCLARLRRVP